MQLVSRKSCDSSRPLHLAIESFGVFSGCFIARRVFTVMFCEYSSEALSVDRVDLKCYTSFKAIIFVMSMRE
jgi:hypothetical protein